VIEQLRVTFNEAVTLDANAFAIVNLAQPLRSMRGLCEYLPVTAIQTAVAVLVIRSGSSLHGAGTNAITGGTGTVIKDGLYMLTTIGRSHPSQAATRRLTTKWCLGVER